ncbi:MAG: nucleotidyl transferase AbiEii/AbiGii toxin family protein [Spirosomaceae bacterium]|jgi:predicted nucleotidyltransferase component of viral defense system|nr:nucleotidyl transferase AbiEii/AbiGii toxin family protein [Spirosomataceae bacterium]
MLFREAVEPRTLGILKDLMQLPALENFALVGGTNLSLRLGHRLSVDLDIFSNQNFESDEIIPEIKSIYNQFNIFRQTKRSFAGVIDDLKIDIVLHPYKYIENIEEIDGIRFVSIPDVVAMKLNAISKRGAKKDFYDLATLLDLYSIEEMLEFFKIKYQNEEIGFVVHSMYYFEDAEKQNDPISLINTTWPDVKLKVTNALDEFMNKNL